MKTVLFVPGLRAPQDGKKFSGLIAAIESKGYEVRFVPINWQRTNVYDWVKQLDTVYVHHDPSQTILAGWFGCLAPTTK